MKLTKGKRKFQSHREDRKNYFLGAKRSIAVENLKLLRTISLIGTILVLFFILLTPHVIRNWKVTGVYIAFAFVLAGCTAVSFLLSARELKNSYVIMGICTVFELLVAAFLIMLDIFLYPNATCVFIPMFLAVCPALFILPYQVIHFFLFFVEFVFIALDLQYKAADIAAADMFHSIVGLVFGVILSIIVTNIRISEHHVKNNYRMLSQVDGLTGLLNKSTSESFIRNYIARGKLDATSVLMIIDIDGFKGINDRYGHQVGDIVLKEVGNILNHMFRSEDIVGRFGGDEFIVLLKDVRVDDLIERKCIQISEQIGEIVVDEDYSKKITCSIGVAETGGRYIPYDDLFKYADDALYEAKSFGKNRFVVHRPQDYKMESKKKYILIVDDLEVERVVLREAVEDNYDILEAASGKEALELISQYSKSIEAVFLDLYMNDLNGFDVLNYMKSRSYTQRIPVIVITTDSASEEKALLCGAQDMLHKPVEPAVAKLRLNNVLKNALK